MKHILVVDDSKEILHMLQLELSDEYDVTPVNSGASALKFLAKKHTDLILVDLEMPEMDGIELFTEIRKQNLGNNIPIVFLTATTLPGIEAKLLELGADEFIAKPFVPIVVKSRIHRLLELYDLKSDLEIRLKEKSDKLEKMTVNTFAAIANVVDSKNKYTMGHSIRVAAYAKSIGKMLNWTEEELKNLYTGALLHDIAKIAVPDKILNKGDVLSDDEFAVIRQHPEMGASILMDVDVTRKIQEGVLYHHEHWDGTGYPRGIKGDEIPVYARIIAIADAYDAMTTDRAYRKRLTTAQVIDEFEKGCGTQFDPDLCRIFINMLTIGFETEESEYIDYNSDEKRENSVLLKEFFKKFTDDIQASQDTESFTGLLNKRGFERRLMSERVDIRGGYFIMMDIDNFKLTNDNFGHLQGDKAILMFANLLSKNFDDGNLICRMGGDEFAVFITKDYTKEQVSEIVEEFMDLFKLETSCEEAFKHLTLSIGISHFPTDGENFETLYKKADRALYIVKYNDKNGYMFYENF